MVGGSFTVGRTNHENQAGILDAPSAISRCSGSETRANGMSVSGRHPSFTGNSYTLQTPHATVHSSLVAEDWLA